MPHGGYHGNMVGLGQSGTTGGPAGMGSPPPKPKTSTTGTTYGPAGMGSPPPSNNNNNNNNNNNTTTIVPKDKPPPDKEKKDFQIVAPGKDPDRDDRPKSKGIMKSDTKPENVFGLEYNMDLTLPSNTLLTPSADQSTDLKVNLQNNDFKTNVTNTIMEFIPASLQDTVGASFVVAQAYFDKGITLDLDKTSEVTLDWADDFTITYTKQLGAN